MIRIAVDGLRSRVLLSVGILVLLVLAIGSAVLGPAFALAVSNGYAVSRLAEERNALTGRTWEFRPDGSSTAPADLLDDAISAVPLPEGQHAATAQLESTRLPAPGALGEVMLLAKAGACDHLLVVGRCPEDVDEVAVLAGDAEADGHEPGDVIDLGPRLGRVTMVGTYRYPTGPSQTAAEQESLEDFWFEPSRLATVPVSVRAGTEVPRRPAPYLVAPERFATLPVSLVLVRVDSRIDVPVDLDVDRLGAIADAAAEDPAPVQAAGGTAAEVSINSLEEVVADIEAERRAALLAVTPAVASLVLVALALLSRLTSAAGELRVPDLALASLRGADRRRVWRLALAEPLLLVVLAVPLGLAGGVGITGLLIRAWLVPGLPLRIPVAAALTAAAVVACAVTVCVLAIRTVLARSLAEQLTGQARPRATGRAVVAGVAVLVALTLVLVTAAISRPAGGVTDSADLLLPLLIAVVLGIGATALARTAASALSRRRGRGVVGFLAVRAVARRSVGTLVVLPLTVAIAVATFGLGTVAAAATWRTSVAATQAPASAVWSTEIPMREAVALTRRLDPEGRHLMAAATWIAQDGNYVVVDAARLPAVSLWQPGWTPGHDVSEVTDLITVSPPPVLTARRLALTLTVPRGADPVTVEMRLHTSAGDDVSVYVGPFEPGTTTAEEPVPCARGCSAEGLALAGAAGLPVELSGTYTVGPLAADGTDAPEVLAEGGWRLTGEELASQAARDVTAADGMLVVTASGNGKAGLTAGGGGRLRPVVAGREVVDVLGDVDAGAARSAVGGAPAVEPVLVAESMPFLGPRAALIDYGVLTTNRSVFEEEFSVRVLAAGDTPDALSDQLAARGLTLERLHERERDRLDATAYALALRLYLIAAALVMLMAVAGLAVTTAIQLPSRRLDAASLSVVGVRRRAVLLSVAVEQGVVLGAAALAGLAAGVAAQLIVLRRITLGQVEEISWPRVDARVDPVLLSVAALGVAALLGAVSVVSAWLTVRRARGASLRERAR